MEPILNIDGYGGLFADLVCNGQDPLLGISNRGFSAAHCDGRFRLRVVRISLFDINEGVGLLLEFINLRSATTKDTSNSTSWDSEFNSLVGLLLILIGLFFVGAK